MLSYQRRLNPIQNGTGRGGKRPSPTFMTFNLNGVATINSKVWEIFLKLFGNNLVWHMSMGKDLVFLFCFHGYHMLRFEADRLRWRTCQISFTTAAFHSFIREDIAMMHCCCKSREFGCCLKKRQQTGKKTIDLNRDPEFSFYWHPKKP